MLPGEQGPVAQFMVRDEQGSMLTLHVSNDVANPRSAAGPGGTTKPGAKNADRSVLAQVSSVGYQQIGGRR